MNALDGVIDKKYLRVPDFIFQTPPLNYVTAVGRNALGLNKKKLTFDDIKNLTERSKQIKEALKGNAKHGNNGGEKENHEIDILAKIDTRRKKPHDDFLEQHAEPGLDNKKQKVEISVDDWLNIPEAKKMTKLVVTDSNKQLVINKYNSLDRDVEKGGDDLLFLNKFDWKEQINNTVKTQLNYEKLLQKSFKKVMKDFIDENLIFHLKLLKESILFIEENRNTFISQVDSILRYTAKNEIWEEAYTILNAIGITDDEKIAFLNKFLENNKNKYKQVGWAIHELYLVTITDDAYDDINENYIAKKKTLSKFIGKYGENIVELLYESCLLETDYLETIKVLISSLPLIEWESYLNKVYESKNLDSFLIVVIEIMIEKRYSKGSIPNLKNLINKFSNHKIKFYILQKIVSTDDSVNVWEYYFNYELKNKRELKEIIDFIKRQVENRNLKNNFEAVLKLFLNKFFYYNALKKQNHITLVMDFVNEVYSKHNEGLLEFLRLQRELQMVFPHKLDKFMAFRQSDGKFLGVEYEIEFINWNIALGFDDSTISGQFSKALKEHSNSQLLTYKYCDYLVSIKCNETLLHVVKDALEKFPLDSKFIDYLFSAVNKDGFTVESTKLKSRYDKMLSIYPHRRNEILFLLEKLLHKEILLDSNNPLNISKINKLLQKYEINESIIKVAPRLGLLVSLRLHFDFQKTSAKNSVAVKTLVKSYLDRYDNNFFVMYQIGLLLKDCKWFLNSIKKNSDFLNPYMLLLADESSIRNYKNFEKVRQLVWSQSLYQINMPALTIEDAASD